ncbi:MAG: hypothetical protein JWQ49_700 [Edaphobacter sp.]|nr:hypothetical protein [Edaphobacter sp.]
MRETVATCVVAVGACLALIVTQGCKKQVAPAAVLPVVSSSRPQVQPDFPVGPLPVEDVDRGATPRVDRTAVRRAQLEPVQVQPVQVQRVDVQAAAVAEVQRRQDERLLQQQEATSERQQEELDQEIEQDLMTQQEMEAEPRIQDVPEMPEGAPTEPMQPR